MEALRERIGAGAPCHEPLAQAVLVPDDRPGRVPVPDVGDDFVRGGRVDAAFVDAQLVVVGVARSLVAPPQFFAPRLVDAVARGRAVVADGAGPPGAAGRALDVLVQATFEDVLALVRVAGDDVRLIRLQHPVEHRAVGDGDVGRRITPVSAERARALKRNVGEDDDRPPGFDPRQIGLQPRQLTGVDVAEIVVVVPEDIVEHDVVHRTPVEGIVGRPEEGNAHARDGAFVLGVEVEAVIHDVAATDAEGGGVAERLDGGLHVGDRLVVKQAHVSAILRLGITQNEEGVVGGGGGGERQGHRRGQ